MKRIILITAGLIMATTGFAQSSYFVPKEIQAAYDNGTRSHKGVPGENYWQNTVKYNLKAELNPQTKMLNGSGTMVYTNNSPDSLRFLIIKLLPNVHKKGGARDYAFGEEHLNDGMIIDSIAISDVAEDIGNRRKFREFGTNLYVIFSRANKLAPGADIDIFLQWHYQVVDHGLRNGAYTDSAFFIGYWYPQIAVYDDVFGWDREDYTGKQETYNKSEMGGFNRAVVEWWFAR